MEGPIRRLAFLRKKWPVRLAVGAIFRNEAAYIAEWIEFHQRQGVERFYLYENNSTDDWESAIAPYRGVIELHRWPDHPGQFSAYADCIRRHRRDTRWIAFIDLDEFLFCPRGDTLPDVLERFPRVAAVCANWRTYGTSGHIDAVHPVTAHYSLRAPDEHPVNAHIKSIVFPALTSTHVENPHFFRLYGPAVGELDDPVTSAFRTPSTTRLLRINHYGTRSLNEFRRKITGPRADIAAPREHPELADLEVVDDPYNWITR